MKILFPRTQFFAHSVVPFVVPSVLPSVLLCVLLCACATAAFGRQGRPPAPRPTPPLPWVEFTSEAGAFTAKFPLRQPKLSQASTRRGPVNLVRHIHEVSIPGQYTFEIDYVDLPAGYNDPELASEGGITGMVRSMMAKGGRVLTNVQVKQGTCEGREATLAIPNPSKGGDAFALGRIYSSGQRYYFMIFVAEMNTETARRLGQTFVDSFAVEGGCSKAVAPVAAPPSETIKSNVPGTADPSTGWRRIESREHGFGVLMPGAAELESESAQVQPFPLSHHTYMHEAERGLYSAEVIGEYPPDFHSGPTAYQSMLDITLFALKRNLEPHGFVLTPSRDLKLGAFPGREYRLSSTKLNAEGRAQLFITPKRLYIFTAIDMGGTPGAEESIERFFSSVRISAR